MRGQEKCHSEVALLELRGKIISCHFFPLLHQHFLWILSSFTVEPRRGLINMLNFKTGMAHASWCFLVTNANTLYVLSF